VQRPIRPDWLIRQANELAGAGRGAGQPRNANLRRAVSAAYYALFHEITLQVARHVVPEPPCTDEARHRFVRLIPHQGVKSVCAWVSGPDRPPPRVFDALMAVRDDTDLRDVAGTFVQLIEARHAADYDHLEPFTKPAVLTRVESAETAIRLLTSRKGTDTYMLFMAHLAATARIQG